MSAQPTAARPTVPARQKAGPPRWTGFEQRTSRAAPTTTTRQRETLPALMHEVQTLSALRRPDRPRHARAGCSGSSDGGYGGASARCCCRSPAPCRRRRSWQPRVTPKTSDALTVNPGSRDQDRSDLSGVAGRNEPDIVIGQPEQHTTTAPVQRNYHGCSGPRRPAPVPPRGSPGPTRRSTLRRQPSRQLKEEQVPQVPQTSSTPRGTHLVRTRAGGAGPGARGDRRDQRLPGRRRGHRHQPLPDRRVGGAAVEAVFAGARGRRTGRTPAPDARPTRSGPWPTAR